MISKTEPSVYLDTGQNSASTRITSEQASNVSNVKRMSVSLPGDTASMLEFLAESQGISQNEALRKAIATEAYLLQERQQGTKVLLQKPNREIREVLFR
ncbi:hypothetical protein GNF10_34215 [Nostoc sp. UCD121]|uniref:hypothetical protein n=1 Tax=unclassified Nostoc TaxID=2593658 RepID=UPI00162A8B5E|nr:MULTISPECIES: hypothetical protein [unclassified Nostoc]MBC1225263.1 hypothetical protein [Nostoc sp. UCD120]MBC1280857.1 hypothetical protein [Nostoc sp. UCD121]